VHAASPRRAGISRNLLTERLRTLEADGVVARGELPPPAARHVYELTAEGRELADAMVPLVAWGPAGWASGRPARALACTGRRSRWSRSPTITTDDETWADVASGETTATAAAAAGRLTLVGDRAAVGRLATIFSRSTVLAQAGGLVQSAHSVSSTVRSS
jgi:DNA-binding MarR family transcriptional regulator